MFAPVRAYTYQMNPGLRQKEWTSTLCVCTSEILYLPDKLEIRQKEGTSTEYVCTEILYLPDKLWN